jgi:thioredoxin-like negative regulator of GroEL
MKARRIKSNSALVLIAAACCSSVQLTGFSSQTASAAAPVAKKVTAGAPEVTAAKALAPLEAAVQANPESADAQLALGLALSQARSYEKARQHLRLALRLGKGAGVAQKANLALMALPKGMQAPKTGAKTRLIASMLGLGRTRGGEAKPTVIDFYANWAQPCKQLDGAISKAKSTYGDKVTFITVNVDDPNSQTIMDQYDVSPIPTMVFLNPEGEVVTYSVGYSGDGQVNAGIKKILPAVN